MTISTSTVAWYNKTLVTATGTPAEVATEIATGASSTASLQHLEDILSWDTYWKPGSNTTLCQATWIVSRTLAEWLALQTG